MATAAAALPLPLPLRRRGGEVDGGRGGTTNGVGSAVPESITDFATKEDLSYVN